MAFVLRFGLSCIAGITIAACFDGAAQAPNVPIYKQGRHEAKFEADMGAAGKELFDWSNVVKFSAIAEQLKKTSCQLELPKLNTTNLTAREVCIAARRSHIRVGWAYLCDKCDEWHVNLAGGYCITS